MDDGMVVLEGTKKVLTDAQNSMPDVERILQDASKGISNRKANDCEAEERSSDS